jgi:hypothetical protein
MTPVVADYRARNLLILRVPATARVPVTAEVATSTSLVVPAIHSEAFSEWSFHSSLPTISEGDGPEIWHRSLF